MVDPIQDLPTVPCTQVGQLVQRQLEHESFQRRVTQAAIYSKSLLPEQQVHPNRPGIKIQRLEHRPRLRLTTPSNGPTLARLTTRPIPPSSLLDSFMLAPMV